MLAIGTRVKYSDSALRSARDYYLSQGESSRRSRAKAEYERQRAVRGTVVAILEPTGYGAARGVQVTCEDGSVVNSLPYRWTEAAD